MVDSGGSGSNKRKIADPSQRNAANLPSSLTEFPRYELSPQQSQNPRRYLGSIGTGSSRTKQVSVAEESDPSDWDDPVACQLEQLLLSNLHTVFHNAIKQIVECGYSEDVAEKSISSSGFYHVGQDLVSNIVNDGLDLLKNGKGVDGSTDHVFEDLQHLVAYTMLEMISVLREVKPSLSIVEAMWWLLVCDLNVLQACQMEGDLLSTLGCKQGSGESSSGSTSQQSSMVQSSEPILSVPNEPNIPKPPLPSAQNYLPKTLKFGSFPNIPNPRNPHAYKGPTPEKESFSSSGAPGECVQNTSPTFVSEEKSGAGRKRNSKKELATLNSKKELATLRQKSSHMEKCRSYGKGAFRTGKLATVGGFVVEKRVKPPPELPVVNTESASSNIKTEVGLATPLVDGSQFSTDTSPGLPVRDNSLTVPRKGCTALLAANTDSATVSSLEKLKPEINASESSNTLDYYAGIPYDESLGKYVPRDKKDELILKLVPRVQELQNELESWTEWANQKVMQAARRLSKDQPELKALRLEKEAAEQFKKEKQILEENNMKKLSEMEAALKNATNQIQRANATARKIEVENSLLKKEMEAAKLEADESAASCQEAIGREKKTLKDLETRDGQKALLQEELEAEKRKVADLQQEVGKAKNRQNQIEARWNQEKVVKEKLLAHAASIRKEREQLEAATKAEEDMIKLKAENDMQKYMEGIKELESKLYELKQKLDSSKIAALRRGIDGSCGSCILDSKAAKGNQIPNAIKGVASVLDNSGSASIKRERECVMCLSEEMTVVFFPCAHQVLCSKCNELHEKEGMKDCPSCRAPIQRRICARFVRP